MKWESVKPFYEKAEDREIWVESTGMHRDYSKIVLIELEDPKKPKLEDFYVDSDPRGCSSSEYDEYLIALEKWEDMHKE